ncbi:putative vegetative incompatibility HET protein [Triangularia verruculosa]|uniref:Vegetative incompatibility HET protein n=1 Tax=Triangularia verruculosa TaxID=2587418 RepID=A0AAN7ASD1_9PEZI|nr:putative vegetative incompatibility HET protein [Triangularia verruculosa]
MMAVGATKTVEIFGSDNTPPHAILSHTWGNEDDELSFREIKNGLLKPGSIGFFKLDGCCKKAQLDGLDYVWIDTCCIDKSDHVELSEAINSMFKWYRNAAICYVYLSDVSPHNRFSHSRWFRRGWTLQELIAPRELSLYSSNWTFIGSREDLASQIELITGIPEDFLYGNGDFHRASVAQRFSWASKRTTKRKEDMAYCLLGLFDVSLPIIYGDDHAFARLQREIMIKLRDDSIFAWGLDHQLSTEAQPWNGSGASAGVLAESPRDFEQCGRITSRGFHNSPSHKFVIESGFLCITTTIYTAENGVIYGLLSCGLQDHTPEGVVGIPLQANTSGDFYFRPQGCNARLFPKQSEALQQEGGLGISSRSIHIQMFRHQELPTLLKPTCSFRIRTAGSQLKVAEVYPSGRLHDNLIHMTAKHNSPEAVDRTWVRLRRHGNANDLQPDFVLVLSFTPQRDGEGKAACAVAVCSCFTTLKEIAANSHLLWKSIFIRPQASNGPQHVSAILRSMPDSMTGHPRIAVVVSSIVSPPPSTINLPQQLERVNLPQRFISALENEDTLNQRLARKTDERQVQVTRLSRAQGMLNVLSKQIEKLEADKKALEAEVRAFEADGDKLQEEKNALESKRTMVTLNRKYLQRCMDEHHDGRDEWLAKLLTRIETGAITSDDDSFLDRRPENIIRLLIAIENSVQPSSKTPGVDVTPLVYAVQRRRSELVQRLLDQGADADEKYLNGKTALLAAVKSADKALVQQLLENGAKVWPALLWTVQYPHKTTLSELLALDQAANEVNLEKLRMLMMLAANQGSRASILALLSWGEGKLRFDLSVKANQDIVWAAAAKGHKSAVETLIEHDSSSHPASCQRLLLRSALENCAVLAYILLKKSKADATVRYFGGRNVLWLAADRGHDAVVEALLKTTSASVVNERDDFDQTALSRSAENGHLNAVMALMQYQDPSIADYADHTAVWYAVINGHLDAVQCLLRHKSVRDDLWEVGKLLWWAVESEQENMVDVILSRDCGPLSFHLGYHDPHALLWNAIGKGNTKIIGKLLEHKPFQHELANRDILRYAGEWHWNEVGRVVSSTLTTKVQEQMTVVVDRVKPHTENKKRVRSGYREETSKARGSMIQFETLSEVEEED